MQKEYGKCEAGEQSGLDQCQKTGNFAVYTYGPNDTMVPMAHYCYKHYKKYNR